MRTSDEKDDHVVGTPLDTPATVSFVPVEFTVSVHVIVKVEVCAVIACDSTVRFVAPVEVEVKHPGVELLTVALI